MPESWSREEVEATVSDYFDMLSRELRGEAFNKREHNRHLQKLLNNRPPGAIERKHQNISAVLIELGYPYIDGYKPLGNYQELLRVVVEGRLTVAAPLQDAAATAVLQPEELVPSVPDILSIIVPPPVRSADDRPLYDKPRITRRLPGRNYLEIEARNQSLGKAGEQFVLRYEHERLWHAGKRSLADRIQHIAQTEGDGAGYDIQSFETDGRERLIEVKTTRFGASTPFFTSRNEVGVSDSRESDYQLYRLYRFSRDPKMFILPGSLHKTCTLDPVLFSATAR